MNEHFESARAHFRPARVKRAKGDHQNRFFLRSPSMWFCTVQKCNNTNILLLSLYMYIILVYTLMLHVFIEATSACARFLIRTDFGLYVAQMGTRHITYIARARTLYECTSLYISDKYMHIRNSDGSCVWLRFCFVMSILLAGTFSVFFFIRFFCFSSVIFVFNICLHAVRIFRTINVHI